MIDFTPNPLKTYQENNPDNYYKIERTGLAIKGLYCTGCEYFKSVSEPRINPWTDEVERTVTTHKCAFFDEPLVATDRDVAPCGCETTNYVKCLSCLYQAYSEDDRKRIVEHFSTLIDNFMEVINDKNK